MSKSKGVVLGAQHVNRVGPGGAIIGNREGYGSPVGPAGYNGKTVGPDFNEPGIRTGPQGNGTPANHVRGNPDESRRVASQHRYGVSPGAGGVDMNDPAANGSGVVLDGGTRQNGMMANPAPPVDSPVSKAAPYFDTRTIAQENKAHLGQGNAQAQDSLVANASGVLGRG